MLASSTGVFAEPASAASIAGLIKLNNRNYFKKQSKKEKIKIVCTLTGCGLKDPDQAIGAIKKPTVVEADKKTVLRAMGYK
jgi:threonine synthase